MKVELPFSSEVKSPKSENFYELFLRFWGNVVFTAGADFAAFGSFIAFTNMISLAVCFFGSDSDKNILEICFSEGVNHSLGVD